MRDRYVIDPRLRVLYLVAVALGVFFFKRLDVLGALALSQMVLWLAVRLGPRALLRQTFKLWGFALFVVASYALTSEDPATDAWIHVPVWKWSLAINTAGALAGCAMVVRVLIVVLASQVARAGDSRAVAAGLGKLGVPTVVAASIDAVLALMGGGGGRGGGGGGGGGGRGRHRGGDDAGGEGFWASLKRLGRGDVGMIVRRIERQIERAEDHVAEQGVSERGRTAARDIAVIAGVSLAMLGIKALKILPSIPFAPGHKLVILTPLYVVAAMKTRTRAGATLTGLTMGTVAFLLGDGRYGIFEILKHVAPGVVCDLCAPALLRGTRTPGRFGCSLVGGLMGAGRFATIFAVTLAVQPPAIAWAMLVPGFLIHTGFGILSGYVTFQLVRALRTDNENVTIAGNVDAAPLDKPALEKASK